MVERPIKKSERQVAEPDSTQDSEESITSYPEKQNTPKPFRKKETAKGKDKGNQQQDTRSQAVSPALMRGPKPKKFDPPTIKETQEETAEDTDTQEEQETSE